MHVLRRQMYFRLLFHKTYCSIKTFTVVSKFLQREKLGLSISVHISHEHFFLISFQRKNPCSDAGCPVNSRCFSDLEHDTYQCVCAVGFTGNCQSGKCNVYLNTLKSCNYTAKLNACEAEIQR